MLLQRTDLPDGNQGLQWIVSKRPGQLLLIPGLCVGSVIAAAAGDQAAHAYLCFTAQYFAAFGGSQNPTRLDKLCLQQSVVSDWRDRNKEEATRISKILLSGQSLQLVRSILLM